jgi:spore coat protein JB
MNAEKERLMKEIMAVDFTLVDLHLYLDTHPWDQKTINYYNHCVQKSMALRRMYETRYGPISAYSPNNRCPWQWAIQPWPWEKEDL